MSIIVKEIKNLNPQELDECLSISKNLFGKKYHSKKYFSNENLLKLIAVKKNTVIGFFMVRQKSQNILIDCIGIRKKWQRKKVGSLLMEYFFKNIVKSDHKVVVYAWKIDNLIPIHRLNLKFGMKKIKNLGMIWKEKCNHSFKCIQFEKSCNCECVLYST